MERMKFTGKDWKKTNFSPNCTNFSSYLPVRKMLQVKYANIWHLSAMAPETIVAVVAANEN